VSLLNGALGGILSSESWTLSQVFYFGAVAGVPYEFHHVNGGLCIDELAELIAPIDKAGREPAPKNDIAHVNADASLEAAIAANVSEEVIMELRSALAMIPSDDRDLWQRMGHALHALGDRGRELWEEWSCRSDKYDAEDAKRVWTSF